MSPNHRRDAQLTTQGPELTHSQRQIWIGQRLHPTCPLYNMAFAFVWPAELDADRFRRAWQRVADASEALRTRLTERDGDQPHCHLAARAPATELLDLASHSDPQAEFHRWCRERCTRPLPLDGPLVDSVLVHLGAGRTGWYLNQHHLVADAWSTKLLHDRVAAEYEALSRENSPETTPKTALEPVAAFPYYQTAAAVRVHAERASQAQLDQAADHWTARRERPGRWVRFYGHGPQRSDEVQGADRGNLASVPPTTASRRWTLRLDPDRSRALDALAGQEGFASLSPDLSRFALFATLLVSWLHRVSGTADLGFDTPVTGRPTAAAKRELGLFIELFPFAAKVEPQESFRSLAAHCLEEAMLLLRHGRPGMSAPTGATASNAVLNYFPAAVGPFAGHRAEVEWVHPGHGDSVHALRLQVHDVSASGRITFHLDFNQALFPEPLQRRGREHFERLLDAMVSDPDHPIATVDLLTEEERQELIALHQPFDPATAPATAPATTAPPRPTQTVVALFQAQAERTPQRVALREGQLEVTFATLRDQTEALAATLVRHGVEPGDRVAIHCRRSTLAVTAILACLRARVAYLPIDPGLPAARLDHLLIDSGARWALVGDADGGGDELSTTPDGVTVLPIAEALQASGEPDLGAADLGPGPSLSDLAYLIYTSGSTGQPKGVLIDHGGLADYLGWASRTYVRGERMSFPLCTALAFDLTVTSLFLPLITGGTLEIYPQGDGPVDTAVLEVARHNAVDFIKLTPSHLALLVGLDLAGSRLRRVVVGGENFRADLAAAIHTKLAGRAEITNEYGPTEAVVGCVAYRYDPEVATGANVPIGRPADHVEIEILNPAGSPVPLGVAGELWISRFGLARGYHRRPELTAERFQPHPDRPGVVRYRSGDRVRVRRQGQQGQLEYLGRLDRQLKISGFRVEPGEIEAALLAEPRITECAVIARQRSAPPTVTARAEASAAAAAAPATILPLPTPTMASVDSVDSADGEVHYCTRCGLPSNYPRATFDEHGVCSICHAYEAIKEQAQGYFKSPAELRELFARSAAAHRPPFDCLMLFSGGKDSSYALAKLVEMGLSVYAFTLDNGFIAEGAKENIRRVADQLGVPVEFASTPAMNAIFRDSLERFSNVCNGCFKAIYTLSTQRAKELAIPIVVTGLSRGQMFETRLTEELFRDGRRSPQEIDAAVLAARKLYHRMDDEVSRSLDVGIFRDDRIFEEVQFVDFYRYHDVGLEEVLAYLQRELPWVRPADTGRSTNCLINDTGIYIHKKERGFHNYALPYSWDVRLGHKRRDEALAELHDEIDLTSVRETLAQVGYDENRGQAPAGSLALEAVYVAAQELPEEELRRHLSAHLPPQLIPVSWRRLEAIPLTASGKLDERALASLSTSERPRRPYRAPQGPVEEFLVEVWSQELWSQEPRHESVGADDHFFELGGTSLSAIQVLLRLCQEFDLDLPLDAMFSHPTLAALARVAEEIILADAEELSEPPHEV